MLSINSNYASAFASNAANTASKGLDSAMEKLSTGSRINYAKDDAAGQAISTRLSAEIQGLAMASRNAADAQSLIDTAEGGMQETHNVLLRMRELAVQSANGTLTDADRQHTDAEFKQLVVLLLEEHSSLLKGVENWLDTLKVVLLQGLELVDGGEEFDELVDSSAEEFELAEDLVWRELKLLALCKSLDV